MRWVIGLGNPGSRYDATRHNVGFMVVDRVAERHGVRFDATSGNMLTARIGEVGMLMKPQTFMNRSGDAVAEALDRGLEVGEMLVVVDDVWLAPGASRLRPEGSSGGHNGLADIERVLGNGAWARLRIGIGGADRTELADHVLAPFGSEEWPVIEKAIDRAVDAASEFIRGGDVATLMPKYNQRAPRLADQDRGEE